MTDFNEYLLPELDKETGYSRPFFSVDSETDSKLAGHAGLAQVTFGAYQGRLPLVDSSQISGKPLPVSVILSKISNYKAYEPLASYKNISWAAANAVTHLFEHTEILKKLPHLQTYYKLCDMDGKPTDLYMPITGLQSIVALSELIAIEHEHPINTIDLSSECDDFGFVQLNHYLSNSSHPYPPLSFDKEFLEQSIENSYDADSADDELMPYSPLEVIADTLLVCVNGYAIDDFHEPQCDMSLPSGDWVTHTLRRLKSPKFRLKKACATADQYTGVYALIAAAIVGKPYSSIERYMTSNSKFTALSIAEKTQVIDDLKPLLENLSIEV